ncbi:putative oxygen-independent coproporphyrinogen III oxidase family protein [Candidatus Competibacter denitrificans Run_A_D11]|uniref:Oxygen-independent coproporphyrinogen III oxidase family protein n=2 Tax=Candidatus Competibacter TaxID=221279 RepID=W6MAI5_9GAMM|nr:putative oxygen-independent coproporphyrinogen III oxidase family protein [Candidatus Competibacter denitrificans Run_A_D11]
MRSFFFQPSAMPTILLTTLNARYFHSSFGLRYLLANMGDLQARTTIQEFIITQRPLDIAEAILATQPRIIGFGVYIWNVAEITQVVALLKQVRPNLIIVLGGLEVSYEWEEQPLFALADYLITGQADFAFAELCRRLIANEPPVENIIHADPPPLDQLVLPYHFYTDEDIAHRLIYVEASRGCPFKCEFCLSALDKTAWPFELERFLTEMEGLYERGVRHFKFVDRTFNLNAKIGGRILDFFLERLDKQLFLHFELIPDHLPDALKERIARFPAGALQFEIGIQTFNPTVQALISRKQDNRKTEEHLHWLRQHTQAHLHADLIVGLPGEDMASFAAGFNRLVALDPHEIQVGILKRLRGAPISRHSAEFGYRYNPHPPYNLLCSRLLDFATVRRLERFARYWDLIGNSGRFRHTRPLLLGDDPFGRLLIFSDWLFAATGQTHQFALDRLFDLVYRGLTVALNVPEAIARDRLVEDYKNNGAKGLPLFLQSQPIPGSLPIPQHPSLSSLKRRQARH